MTDPAMPAAALCLGVAAATFAPGLAALELSRHPARGWNRLGLAIGLSQAWWAVFVLWVTRLGWHAGPRAVGVAVALLGLAAIVLQLARWRRRRPSLHGLRPADIAVGMLVAVSIALRAAHARGLVVAPWVDGYHHTVVVELMLQRGGVPADWSPFLDTARFYYHFGFHALAAVVSWLTGAPAMQSVLWTGQALNALLPLAMYPLLVRLARRPEAAALGVAVPVSLYYFPAYYASWSRYTQLAGLAVLPAAWILLYDALRARRRPRAAVLIGLAAVLGAGLFLVHVRVFAFYAIGAAIIGLGVSCCASRPSAGAAISAARSAGGRIWQVAFGVGRRPRWSWPASARWLAVVVCGALLASPWIAGALVPAVEAREAQSSSWYGATSEVNNVPGWLFTVQDNRTWLILGGIGLAAGLAARRRGAWATTACLALGLALVNLYRLGLAPSTLLPPFALAISAFVPVAAGVALGGSVAVERVPLRWRRHLLGGLASAAVLLALWGAWRMPTIVNPATVIATEADVEASRWIASNTEPMACFLITAGHWQLGTYRGLDGGYWLPLLARRPVTTPAAFYNHGRRDYALEVKRIAETAARGDALADADFLALMRETGAEYVYVGPASQGAKEAFDADRVRRIAGLVPLYEHDGVFVFRLEDDRPGPEPARGAAASICQPIGAP